MEGEQNLYLLPLTTHFSNQRKKSHLHRKQLQKHLMQLYIYERLKSKKVCTLIISLSSLLLDKVIFKIQHIKPYMKCRPIWEDDIYLCRWQNPFVLVHTFFHLDIFRNKIPKIVNVELALWPLNKFYCNCRLPEQVTGWNSESDRWRPSLHIRDSKSK